MDKRDTVSSFYFTRQESDSLGYLAAGIGLGKQNKEYLLQKK
jgi:hypothetical protein